jgi:hypothetical protein
MVTTISQTAAITFPPDSTAQTIWLLPSSRLSAYPTYPLLACSTATTSSAATSSTTRIGFSCLHPIFITVTLAPLLLLSYLPLLGRCIFALLWTVLLVTYILRKCTFTLHLLVRPKLDQQQQRLPINLQGGRRVTVHPDNTHLRLNLSAHSTQNNVKR